MKPGPRTHPPPEEGATRPEGARPGAGHEARGEGTPRRSAAQRSRESVRAGKPRPIPVEALGPALGPFAAELAEEIQVPRDWCALLSLATVAALAQTRATIRLGPRWSEPLNLYALGLGEPGERKSACMDRFVSWLRPYEDERIAAARPLLAQAAAARDIAERALNEARGAGVGLAEAHEALAAVETPPNGRILAPSDVTPEALVEAMHAAGGALAWLEPEGDALQTGIRYQGTAPNHGLLKRAWSGETFRMHRRRNGGEALELPRPLLTIAVLAQRDAVFRWAQQPGVTGEGLLPRFVFAVPESRLGSRLVNPPLVTCEAERAFRSALERAHNVEVGTELVLTPEATKVFEAWRRETEKRLAPSGDLRAESAWGSKLTGNVGRIAGLLHVAEEATGGREVSGDVVARACAIGETLADHWLAFRGEVGANRSEAVRVAVLEVIDARGPCTLRDLEKTHRAALSDRAEVRATLAELVEDGELDVLSEPTGGRPTKRWGRKPVRPKSDQRPESPPGQAPTFGTNGTSGPSVLSGPGVEPPPPSDADRPPWLDAEPLPAEAWS